MQDIPQTRSTGRSGRGACLCACLLALLMGRALAGDILDRSLEDLLGQGLSTAPRNVEVSTASKYRQSLQNAPSALRVLTAEDIKTQGWRTFGEIVRALPGVFVSQDRNYSFIGVRGFLRPGDYNSRVLVLIDGQRLNDNLYDTVGYSNDFLLDADLIERVEYSPGPGSAIYGNNAFFGVINVFTKSGRDLRGGQISAEYGGFETYKIRGSYGKRFENGAEVLLSATGFDREGPKHLFYSEFDALGQNRGRAEGLDYDRDHSAFAKASYGPFRLEGGYVRRVKGLPAAPYGIAFNDPAAKTIDANAFVSGRYDDMIAPDWDLHLRLGYQRTEYQGDYPYDRPPYDINREHGLGEWWSGEIRLGYTGFERHHVLFGAEIQDNVRQYQDNYDVFGGTSYLKKPYRSLRYGFYLQDEIRLLDSLSLSLGMRYDHQPLGESANPRAGLIWRPWEATAVKLLYGSAFRAPNVYERFYADIVTYKSNSNLRPERNRTIELVVEQFLGRSMRLTASLYRYDVSNLIRQTRDPSDGLIFYDNLDRAQGQGLELEAERRFESGLNIALNYALQRTEGSHGHKLTNSPSHLLKLRLSMPLWSESWRLGLETQYMSERFTRTGRQVSDYVLSNLTLNADLTKSLRLSFGVYNAWNQRYADPVGDDFVQDRILQDGRSFRLKLTLGF
jgi:iron complex outermembrane receptor protein